MEAPTGIGARRTRRAKLLAVGMVLVGSSAKDKAGPATA